jgi:phosphatidylglycerophosphatase A
MISAPPPALRGPDPVFGGAVVPSLRLMLTHPAHLLSFGFGAGLMRFAPGTWGTLFAWASFAVLDRWLSDPGWLALIAATLVFGAAAAQRTGQILGRADHGAIVVDEIVAFWIVLWLLPAGLMTQASAFLGFRLFDIVKPPPIRALDARYKHGIGVMLDDLFAAFYTLLVAAVLMRWFG